MKQLSSFLIPCLLISLSLISCDPNMPADNKANTVTYEELDSVFPNPEKGFNAQVYYTSDDLTKVASASSMISERNKEFAQTLYLHSYYLTDYIESDIAQEFLDRLEANMNALRESGGKAIVRFSYKSNEGNQYKPWDASPEWISRHIDQLAPLVNKHADVIYCFQAGFIGVWGEWYYTTNFKMNPTKDEDWQPRWDMLNHLLEAFPHDRQICLRTPAYKIKYLTQMGLDPSPLDETTAHKGDAKSRLAGHNDCFISGSNDVGTYNSSADRTFWEQDTRYTVMGGETCQECALSGGENAITQMGRYHWTHINRSYVASVVYGWKASGHFDYIVQHLGYRIVLEKAVFKKEPKLDKEFKLVLTMHNDGFAAPQNARNVELILIKDNEKYVYKQENVDPRFWIPENGTFTETLSCKFDPNMSGTYGVYLNLPDPYPSLHDDPRYSIRLYNKYIWDENTGYHKLGEITINDK